MILFARCERPHLFLMLQIYIAKEELLGTWEYSLTESDKLEIARTSAKGYLCTRAHALFFKCNYFLNAIIF